MKKICMVVPSFTAKGGIAAVVSGYRNSELEKRYSIKYIESYCDGGKVSKTLKAIIAYFIFMKELIFNKPDLIHIHSSFGGSFYRKLPFIVGSYIFKLPIINHIHGANFDDFYINASKKKKQRIKNIYRKCTKIIVLSEEWKENIRQIVDENKIIVIENYSILNTDAIEKRKLKKKENNVLFLGFICKRKGCYDIPAIVEKVKEKIPNVRFILAGSGDIEQVKAITSDKIKKNIFYPGWVRNENKDKLLREADLFFLPSYHEGMPMAILDAMGYGLPIVSTAVGGISKIVCDSENGYICNPGDIENIANSIINILENEIKLKKMGNNSIKIVKDKYSLEKHIKKICLLYDENF